MNKTVSWYLLDYAGQLTDALTPDLTEDIDLCQWVPVTDLVETLEGGAALPGPGASAHPAIPQRSGGLERRIGGVGRASPFPLKGEGWDGGASPYQCWARLVTRL